ncbi:MAG: hypothetical protein PHX18_03495 [Candidatus Gastranaerophilales bacterium]|nr:hypothetical protein [Candidatus Gastranaerophilales bacterium]
MRIQRVNNTYTNKYPHNTLSDMAFAGKIKPASIATNTVLKSPSLKRKFLNLTGIGLIGFIAMLGGQKIRQNYMRNLLNADPALSAISTNNQNIGDFSRIMLEGRIKHIFSGLKFKTYALEKTKGINFETCSDYEDLILAKNAQRIAAYFKTAGNCYTGAKHALLTSGVIKDYGDMPLGIASNAVKYFERHNDKFQEILSKTGKNLTPEELRALPAGHIVVYSKEGLPGHIAVTNGRGQGMSDSFDNMRWVEEHGEGAAFRVFKLTEGWFFNPKTKALEFHNKK